MHGSSSSPSRTGKGKICVFWRAIRPVRAAVPARRPHRPSRNTRPRRGCGSYGHRVRSRKVARNDALLRHSRQTVMRPGRTRSMYYSREAKMRVASQPVLRDQKSWESSRIRQGRLASSKTLVIPNFEHSSPELALARPSTRNENKALQFRARRRRRGSAEAAPRCGITSYFLLHSRLRRSGRRSAATWNRCRR